MFLRIYLVSLMGMLEYMFVMSREANMDVDVTGVCFSSRIISVEFLMLNVYGSEANCLILVVSSWESLYAGAFLQLTTGRISWSSLCSLIRPFIVGAEGFRFTYLHLESLGNNSQTSKYALHLLEHSHTLGNMQDIMQVLQFQKKDIHLDTSTSTYIDRRP